jgi:hypothetical protein
LLFEQAVKEPSMRLGRDIPRADIELYRQTGGLCRKRKD